MKKERKKLKNDRFPKEINIYEKISHALEKGYYSDTRHSTQRGLERNISLIDIITVLETGYHEKNKDEFKSDFQSWNYSICGKTLDGDKLRVAIYFEGDMLMIATVIRLK